METQNVIARLIKHKASVDPLPMLKTLEDILSFSSVVCTLKTSRPEKIDPEKRVFVILVCEGEEKVYIMYLLKSEDKSHKCIGYSLLTDWDGDATLTRN